MNRPLVSVIVPAYNSERYISDCIESVLSQSYKPVELIIVDDGSTDRTKEIVLQYRDLTYIYQVNGGPSMARNRGIMKAKGKYIAFLDSDDLWISDKLEQQVKLLESHPDIGLLSGDMLCFTGSRIVVSSMFKKYGFDRNYFEDDFYVVDAYRKIFTYGNHISTPTVMMKRDCFDKTGYFDENLRHSEDCDLWLRVAMHFKIAYSLQVWLKRRNHKNNLTGDSESMNISLLNVLEKHERQYKSYLILNVINSNKVISDKYSNVGYLMLINYRLKNARQIFLKSLLRRFKVKTFLYWLSTYLSISTVKRIRSLRNKEAIDET